MDHWLEQREEEGTSSSVRSKSNLKLASRAGAINRQPMPGSLSLLILLNIRPFWRYTFCLKQISSQEINRIHYHYFLNSDSPSAHPSMIVVCGQSLFIIVRVEKRFHRLSESRGGEEGSCSGVSKKCVGEYPVVDRTGPRGLGLLELLGQGGHFSASQRLMNDGYRVSQNQPGMVVKERKEKKIGKQSLPGGFSNKGNKSNNGNWLLTELISSLQRTQLWCQGKSRIEKCLLIGRPLCPALRPSLILPRD